MEILYGVRSSDGKIVSIKDVPAAMSGLKCECTCAHCGRPLQACSTKEENKKRAYFRHNPECKMPFETDKMSDCAPLAVNETALHKMVKQILKDEKSILVPPKIISLQEAGLVGLPKGIEKKITMYKLREQESIKCNIIEIEKTRDDFIPDVIMQTENGELFVEVYVCHKVNNDKKAKVRKYGSQMLEINLSNYMYAALSQNDLRKLLTASTKHKRWIYFPLTESVIKEARQYYETQPAIKEYRKKYGKEIEEECDRLNYLDTLDPYRNDIRCFYKHVDYYKCIACGEWVLYSQIKGASQSSLNTCVCSTCAKAAGTEDAEEIYDFFASP